MIYQRIYDSIITHAKIEELLGIRQRGNEIYYEGHHVFPKSLFPELVKAKENIVLLTAREHFVCHRLLTRIYPVSQMFYALWRMCCGERNGNLHISSREYARIREECRRNINWEEHGRKVSESWSKKSPEEKQSIILRHAQVMKNLSAERKAEIKRKELDTKSKRTESQKQATYEMRKNTWGSKSQEEIKEIRKKCRRTMRQRYPNSHVMEKVNQLLDEMPFVKDLHKTEYQEFIDAEMSASDFLRFLYKCRTPEQLELQKQMVGQKRRQIIANWSEQFKESIRRRHKQTVANWSDEFRKSVSEKHKRTVAGWSEEYKRSIYENRNTDYLTDPEKRAMWNEKKRQGLVNRSNKEKQASLKKWKESLKKTNEERKRKISQTLKNKTSEQKMQKRLKEAATRAAWSEERKLECSRKRSERQSKYLWWNNGVVNKMSELQPGPNFIPGRLPFKKNK